jgi:hypothetical protein
MLGLEDRETFGMHCRWSKLGEAVNLGLGIGIFCIVVEGFLLFLVFFLFVMIYFFCQPFLGIILVHRGRCTLMRG